MAPKITIQNDLKTKAKTVHKQFMVQVTGYIVTAFGLIAGLAWNDAVKTMIEHFYPGSSSTVVAKFAYAVIISLVVVLVTILLTRAAVRREEKE